MTWAMKIADERDEAYAIGREQGISVGLEQGIEQGAYQTKLETAKTMLSIGLPEEQIQLCTSLPLETIQELRDEINKESLHPQNSPSPSPLTSQ